MMENEDWAGRSVMERPLAELLDLKRAKKIAVKRRRAISSKSKALIVVASEENEGNSTGFAEETNGFRVRVSMFDESIENHFRAMDTISELCGEADESELDVNEIQRHKSSITFLREWRLFKYKPRNVRLATEVEGPQGKHFTDDINLSQFSSATVPKKIEQFGETPCPEPRDFVMYVGGSVWALDWCPRVHETNNSHVKCEFIAIAVHPPDSSYHKVGAPLSGRGLIQIWCLLNVSGKDKEICSDIQKPKGGRPRKEKTIEKKPKGRPRKEKTIEKKPKGRPRKEKPIEKRPKGRPRKNPKEETLKILDSSNPHDEAPAIQVPENSSTLLAIEGIPEDTGGTLIPQDYVYSETLPQGRSMEDEDHIMSRNDTIRGSLDVSSSSHLIPKKVDLPRVVLCLAHNGKVAWDVKWRPSGFHSSKCKHHMGYLAAVLGNGSLEVWQVPLPRAMKSIYFSSPGEGTDPRFVKLEAVFRCSILKSGITQSIPLTVEWSAAQPHDYLLAGCHDGTVALWKFSATSSSKDTRPLLCFSADTVPIRAVAWAPIERDSEGANVILTAGHGGLKFWDLRDPFHPIWALHPVPRIIYSVDWLPNPRCVILSFDDGTMRILSLVKSASDIPVNGKSVAGTKQQGLHTFYCSSSFAIWSVQVSRQTGLVAYCGTDGNVARFQLTTRAVDVDFLRNRAPHFLCGSITEEESIITVITPIPDTPLPFKKPLTFGETQPTKAQLSSGVKHVKSNDKIGECDTQDDAPLALCYGNDAEAMSEPEENLASVKKKGKPNSGVGKRKKADENQTLVCTKEVQSTQKTENYREEAENKFEVIPPKAVAMHRVRWNMNKGSEKWLCYGGAAGIVRCQEILLSDTEKKLAMKR